MCLSTAALKSGKDGRQMVYWFMKGTVIINQLFSYAIHMLALQFSERSIGSATAVALGSLTSLVTDARLFDSGCFAAYSSF